MSVEEAVRSSRLVRFGTFEVDLPAGELRKSGVKLKLTGQPFQVLAILLERPGEVVTREELQKRLWPDTFVDVDHNLNTAINKIREVLGDSAESPRFVETLPRRGYRFIAPVEGAQTTDLAGGSGARQRIANAVGPPHLDPVRRPCVARRGGLFHLQAAASLLRRQRSGRSRASLLTMACRSAPPGHRRTLHRLQFQPWRQVRHLGAAGQWRRSGADHQGTGSQLAARLVARREVHCVSFRRRRGRLVRRARAWRCKDWKEESRLSDITLAGRRTARRSCSRQHNLPV